MMSSSGDEEDDAGASGITTSVTCSARLLSPSCCIWGVPGMVASVSGRQETIAEGLSEPPDTN